MERVSVVGLGKLGACLAGGLAGRGKLVVGVDVDEGVVAAMNSGRAPVPEPGLEERLREHAGRVRATTDIEEAVRATDVTFVVVPTPSDSRGAFSLEFATAAFRHIARALAAKEGYHLVVLTSTVLPGSTRYALLPLLERISGRRCGVDFGVCYSPAFIALGSVIHDFLNPDLVVIGESDERAGTALERLYRDVLENDAPVRRMSLENAELTKLALNTFVTAKISFANMLADLCERIPGGDVDVVSDALGLDRRVGRAYLTGGLGYGGPCFPRDNLALSFLARALGTTAPLAESTDAANRAVPERVLDRIRALERPDARFAVLGLAYKPGTPVTEASQGAWLARALAAEGGSVVAFDPLAGPALKDELGPGVTVADTVEEALADAEVVLVCTPDPVFRSVPPAAFNGKPRVVTVVDFWRALSGDLSEGGGIRYVAVGRSVDDGAAAERLASLWSEPAEGA